MRWSLCIASAILIIIPVFSTPIPRLFLRRRGLFEETLQATDATVDVYCGQVLSVNSPPAMLSTLTFHLIEDIWPLLTKLVENFNARKGAAHCVECIVAGGHL